MQVKPASSDRRGLDRAALKSARHSGIEMRDCGEGPGLTGTLLGRRAVRVRVGAGRRVGRSRESEAALGHAAKRFVIRDRASGIDACVCVREPAAQLLVVDQFMQASPPELIGEVGRVGGLSTVGVVS